MAEFTFDQGADKPYFAVQLKGSLDNLPINLTGYTVAFYFRNVRSKTAKVTAGATTITDAVNGKVEYRWGVADLDEVGTYIADFRIVDGSSKEQPVYIEDVQVREKVG